MLSAHSGRGGGVSVPIQKEGEGQYPFRKGEGPVPIQKGGGGQCPFREGEGQHPFRKVERQNPSSSAEGREQCQSESGTAIQLEEGCDSHFIRVKANQSSNGSHFEGV